MVASTMQRQAARLLRAWAHGPEEKLAELGEPHHTVRVL